MVEGSVEVAAGNVAILGVGRVAQLLPHLAVLAVLLLPLLVTGIRVFCDRAHRTLLEKPRE